MILWDQCQLIRKYMFFTKLLVSTPGLVSYLGEEEYMVQQDHTEPLLDHPTINKKTVFINKLQ